MVIAELLVERGSYGDKSEQWGEFRFLGLPSPGDRIAVEHEETTHYLTVLCVHHRPVSAAASDNDPYAHVVAKWTGSGA
jgi:hypothetical protein